MKEALRHKRTEELAHIVNEIHDKYLKLTQKGVSNAKAALIKQYGDKVRSDYVELAEAAPQVENSQKPAENSPEKSSPISPKTENSPSDLDIIRNKIDEIFSEDSQNTSAPGDNPGIKGGGQYA